MSFWGSRRGGLVLLLLVVGAGMYVYTSRATRDIGGAIQREGPVDAFDLRVGDCFNEETGAIAASLTEVFSVPAVPCGQPHDNEVFAVFDVDVESFPEADLLDELAFDGCIGYFEPYVGLDYESSELVVTTLRPTYKSWHDSGDREVVCVLYHIDSDLLNGSVRGSRL
jgi:Septum formation